MHLKFELWKNWRVLLMKWSKDSSKMILFSMETKTWKVGGKAHKEHTTQLTYVTHRELKHRFTKSLSQDCKLAVQEKFNLMSSLTWNSFTTFYGNKMAMVLSHQFHYILLGKVSGIVRMDWDMILLFKSSWSLESSRGMRKMGKSFRVIWLESSLPM